MGISQVEPAVVTKLSTRTRQASCGAGVKRGVRRWKQGAILAPAAAKLDVRLDRDSQQGYDSAVTSYL